MHGSSGRAPPRGSWPALLERTDREGVGRAPAPAEERLRTRVASVNAARNHVARRPGAPAELEELVEAVLAAAAHEFKTPLAIVRAHAELIHRGWSGSQAGAEIITRQVDRLAHLVQQCIELSRVRFAPARESTELFDLTALVEKVFARARASARRHELRCLGRDPAPVRGDADRIEHAVANLVDNAVRYSPRGGAIEGTVRSTGRHVVVSVHDEGPGIPDDLQRRLAEPLLRALRGRRGDPGGLGLGLRVSRHIVACHGGHLWFESGPGEGSTFAFALPRADATSSSTLPKLILVVDDEEDLRSLVEFVLGAAGYRVRTAADGREALECVLEEMPALIFLDMRMPGMDGWTFAREFRARYGRVCPIVVTTAAESARARAREIDAEAWLAKPFDVEEVIRAAEHYLAGSASPAPARE